jgi:hypothetical protein
MRSHLRRKATNATKPTQSRCESARRLCYSERIILKNHQFCICAVPNRHDHVLLEDIYGLSLSEKGSRSLYENRIPGCVASKTVEYDTIVHARAGILSLLLQPSTCLFRLVFELVRPIILRLKRVSGA